MGWIVLFVVTVGIAWVANRRRRRTAWGTIGAALSSSLAFQVLTAWQLGHLDPFAPVAVLVSLLVTLPLSWTVGWLVWRGRGNIWRDDET
jgi:nucleoside permease NupC